MNNILKQKLKHYEKTVVSLLVSSLLLQPFTVFGAEGAVTRYVYGDHEGVATVSVDASEGEAVGIDGDSLESSVDNETIEVLGEDSLVKMLSAEVNDELKQMQCSGNYVSSVEIEGKTAVVDFKAMDFAKLVVAIYEENSYKMVTTGETSISDEDTTARVNFDEELPEYFIVRSFIIGEDLKPLSPVFETLNYTKKMQEFFAVTTDDFDPENVLNLDGDKENNFLVYDESVIRVQEDGINNILLSSDYDSMTYIFDSANDELKNLKEGDSLAYESNDGNYIFVVVRSVTVSGERVTVAGQDSSIEGMFSYVKIDSTAEGVDAQVDASELPDGISYEGETGGESIEDVSGIEDVGIINLPFSAKYTLKEFEPVSKNGSKGMASGSLNVNGDVTFGLNAEIKIYFSLLHDVDTHVEVEIKYGFSGALAVNGTGRVEIPVGLIILPIAAGSVNVKFKPKFVIEGSADVEIDFNLSGTVGYNSKSGGYFNPGKCDVSVSGEVTVFIGLDLGPEIKVGGGFLADVEMEAAAGVEAKGAIEHSLIEGGADIFGVDESIHACDFCVDGDISIKVELAVEAKILNNENLKVELGPYGFTGKLWDFYWSLDNNEFGFGTCPHILYRVTYEARYASGSPAINATLRASNLFDIAEDGSAQRVAEITTDKSGKAVAYQPNGKYTITVTTTEGYTKAASYAIKDAGKKVVLPPIGSDQGVEATGLSGKNLEMNGAAVLHESFKNLDSQMVYNFYVMKDREDEEPLSTKNLLFLDQVVSDEQGNIFFDYEPKTAYSGADAFVVRSDMHGVSECMPKRIDYTPSEDRPSSDEGEGKEDTTPSEDRPRSDKGEGKEGTTPSEDRPSSDEGEGKEGITPSEDRPSSDEGEGKEGTTPSEDRPSSDEGEGKEGITPSKNQADSDEDERKEDTQSENQARSEESNEDNTAPGENNSTPEGGVDSDKSSSASGNGFDLVKGVKNIKLKEEECSLDVGSSIKLVVIGDNGEQISANYITFSVEDSSAAVIGSDGVLHGNAVGRITVTAKLNGTNLSSTCIVLVGMGKEEFTDGNVKYEVCYAKSVSANGKKHFEKGRGSDSKKKAYDVEVVVLKNGEKLPQSAYKTSFKNNKKAGTGKFKVTLKKKATGASKNAVKTIKKKWYNFEIK